MFSRQLHLITLALVIGAGAAQGQGDSKRTSKGGSVAPKPNLVALETHDGLAAEFRRLVVAATGATATTADRQALARFGRNSVVPQLKSESFALFTAFDSVVGGGYAVPATLLDLNAINFLVKEVERAAGTADRVTFNERAYGLSVALEGYFTKVDLLIVPVLNQRLSGAALSAVLTSLEAGRTAP